MAEPLAVDPSRLNAVAKKLAGLVFPSAPAPMAAAGTDPVSSAINATMPSMESLVSDGLPAVKAALTRTATNMSNAADIYMKADQSLGDGLTRFQLGSGVTTLAAGATGEGQLAKLMGTPLDKVSAGISTTASALAPRVAATVPQLVQLSPQAAQMATQASPMLVQTVSQFAQQGSSAGSQGAAPAQLVSDTKQDGDDKDTESDTEEDAPGEGAAPGTQNVGKAPTQGNTGGSPASPSVATT